MNEQDYPVEHGRLQFLVNRDGADETAEFAKRVMKAYRQVVLNGFRLPGGGSANGCPAQMREGFIRSYLDFKRYARRGVTIDGETVDGEGA